MERSDTRKKRQADDEGFVEVPRALLHELADNMRETAKSYRHAATSYKGLAAFIDSLADD